MSNLVEYAKEELKHYNSSMYGEMLNEAILEIVEVFAKQGHSGYSAKLAAKAAGRLMNFKPLTPLTGENDEWNELDYLGGHARWQNKRHTSLFKDDDGFCYDLDAVTFEDVDEPGIYFTNGDLVRRYHRGIPRIKFPYMPADKPVVCKVKELNDGTRVIVDYGAGRR